MGRNKNATNPVNSGKPAADEVVKVLILKSFRDIHTKEVYSNRQGKNIVEMTESRFNEAEKNLKKKGGGYIKRYIETPPETPVPDANQAPDANPTPDANQAPDANPTPDANQAPDANPTPDANQAPDAN